MPGGEGGFSSISCRLRSRHCQRPTEVTLPLEEAEGRSTGRGDLAGTLKPPVNPAISEACPRKKIMKNGLCEEPKPFQLWRKHASNYSPSKRRNWSCETSRPSPTGAVWPGPIKMRATQRLVHGRHWTSGSCCPAVISNVGKESVSVGLSPTGCYMKQAGPLPLPTPHT